MTFGGFILGLLMFAVGFVMIWRTRYFDDFFGDIGVALGLYNSSWFNWKTLGVIFMFVGFLVAFGLIQAFISATFGQIFQGA